MTRKQIESKFGVKITNDNYFNRYGKFVKAYKIYAADGSMWANGLRTIADVLEECENWKQALLEIKAIVDNNPDVDFRYE